MFLVSLFLRLAGGMCQAKADRAAVLEDTAGKGLHRCHNEAEG
jgi:hypothetical protein